MDEVTIVRSAAPEDDSYAAADEELDAAKKEELFDKSLESRAGHV